MKKASILLLGLFCFVQFIAAQSKQDATTQAAEVKPEIKDTCNPADVWSFKKSVSLFLAQNAFSPYFKGGGINSIALGTHDEFLWVYKCQDRSWENKFNLKYGIIKLGDFPFQKNEDLIEIDSKYNHQFNKHLRLTGLFNIQTRIHDHYEIKKTGERGKLIGNFFAPAFINLGTGLDYVLWNKAFSIYYTPINSKITIVHDPGLAAQYLPAEFVNRGVRYELGTLIRVQIKKEIMENVVFETIGNFFTNHLNSFGNFDVDVENKLDFKINKFLSANIVTKLVYDEDILFDIVDSEGVETGVKGPRTQFQERFNIGLSHTF